MSVVSGGVTAGVFDGGLPSRAPAGEGLAAVRPPQPLPGLDTADLIGACDCDVDAIVGWQVWRAWQPDILLEAASTVVATALIPLTRSGAPIRQPEGALAREALRLARMGWAPSNPVAAL